MEPLWLKVSFLCVFKPINHNTFFCYQPSRYFLLRYLRNRCIAVYCRKKGFALLALYYLDIGGTLTFSIGEDSWKLRLISNILISISVIAHCMSNILKIIRCPWVVWMHKQVHENINLCYDETIEFYFLRLHSQCRFSAVPAVGVN